MMACWNPADTEDAPEPEVERFTWPAGLTVITLLSAGGWCLLFAAWSWSAS